MAKYVCKRLFMAVLTVFVVATLTFFLMNAVPGGPYEAEKSISPQAKAALEAKFGLDKPLFEQVTMSGRSRTKGKLKFEVNAMFKKPEEK